MKIELYFDVRFLRTEDEHKRAREEGCYIEAFNSDHRFRFVRKISLPCLPQKGQRYHLSFDPICGTSYNDGDDTSYSVQESGYIEEDDRIIPYFIISDDYLFSEWLEDDPARANLTDSEQSRQWKAYVKEQIISLTESFKEHGWED